MKKLIATEFDYTFRNEYGQERAQHGSYLGRKIATERTIRQFLSNTFKTYTPADKLLTITLRGNYVSNWIAK